MGENQIQSKATSPIRWGAHGIVGGHEMGAHTCEVAGAKPMRQVPGCASLDLQGGSVGTSLRTMALLEACQTSPAKSWQEGPDLIPEGSNRDMSSHRSFSNIQRRRRPRNTKMNLVKSYCLTWGVLIEKSVFLGGFKKGISRIMGLLANPSLRSPCNQPTCCSGRTK